MRSLFSITFFLLALVAGASSFVVPAPCARSRTAQTKTASSSDDSGRLRHIDHAHTRRPRAQPHGEATTAGKSLLVLAAAPRGSGDNGGDELEEKAGIEPKCEFANLCLIDLDRRAPVCRCRNTAFVACGVCLAPTAVTFTTSGYTCLNEPQNRAPAVQARSCADACGVRSLDGCVYLRVRSCVMPHV